MSKQAADFLEAMGTCKGADEMYDFYVNNIDKVLGEPVGAVWSEEKQIACFGVTSQQLEEQTEDWASRFSTNKEQRRQQYGMLAMSMLSDSQEEIEMGLNERARQHINCAKWIISTKLLEHYTGA